MKREIKKPKLKWEKLKDSVWLTRFLGRYGVIWYLEIREEGYLFKLDGVALCDSYGPHKRKSLKEAKALATKFKNAHS